MNRIKLFLIWGLCTSGAVIAALWMLCAIIVNSERAWTIAIGFDQVANAAFGGAEDETISSRCWRYRADYPYKLLVTVIDFLFRNPNHCRDSFINEQARRAQVRTDE